MILVSIAGIIAILILLHVFIPWGVKIILRRRFLQCANESSHVYLTFDDGPDPQVTPAILDLLDAHGAKASFFILGRSAENHPALVQRIKQSGHSIGDHSYAHKNAWKTGPIATAVDLLHGNLVLTSVIDSLPRFHRPPFGKLNFVSLLFLLMRRPVVVSWDIDPEDYKSSPGQSIAQYVIERMKPGSVVLLHDGRYNAAVSNRSAENTLEALRAILEAGREKRLTFQSLDSLFPMSKGTVKSRAA